VKSSSIDENMKAVH